MWIPCWCNYWLLPQCQLKEWWTGIITNKQNFLSLNCFTELVLFYGSFVIMFTGIWLKQIHANRVLIEAIYYILAGAKLYFHWSWYQFLLFSRLSFWRSLPPLLGKDRKELQHRAELTAEALTPKRSIKLQEIENAILQILWSCCKNDWLCAWPWDWQWAWCAEINFGSAILLIL